MHALIQIFSEENSEYQCSLQTYICSSNSNFHIISNDCSHRACSQNINRIFVKKLEEYFEYPLVYLDYKLRFDKSSNDELDRCLCEN